MARFVVRRLLLLVPILLGVSLLLFFWIRALPGTPAQAILGERATPAAIARFNRQYGLTRPLYVQYWAYLETTVVHGDLGTSVASRRPVRTEIKERFPATVESRGRSHDFRPPRGAASRVLRREAVRAGLRPLEPVLVVDRDLHTRVLSRDHPQVRLLGEARLAAEHRPPGRPDRRRTSDGLLRARRDRHPQLGSRLGRGQAPDPACDRARLDPARDHRQGHPGVDARRPERGLRTHGKGQGSGAGCRRPPPRPPERAPAGDDDHRPPGRDPARGSRAHRDGIRDPGDGLVAEGGDLQPRLPGLTGRNPVSGVRLRDRQPARRHRVRASSIRGSGCS